MDNYDIALQLLKKAEVAVVAGDLEDADLAIQSLKPVLDLRRAEDILHLKSRIDSLSVGVREIRQRSATQLRELRQSRGGVEAYTVVTGL